MTASPDSYRFQIHAVTPAPSLSADAVLVGGVPYLLGDLLWEEPEGREREWSTKDRVRSLLDNADRLALRRRGRVLAGTKSLCGDATFIGCYVTSPDSARVREVAFGSQAVAS